MVLNQISKWENVKDVSFILSRRGGIPQSKRKEKKNRIWKQQMLKGLASPKKKFEEEKWKHTVLTRKEKKLLIF